MSLLDAFSAIKTKLGDVRDAVLQITPTEKKVREATTNDPWGARISLKREIAEATHNYTLFREAMGMLWRRMAEQGPNWRTCQKSLDLLKYLLVHGSDHVLAEAKVEAQSISRLQTFYYTDDHGREVAAPVRDSAKAISRMLRDPDYLDRERKQGRKMASRIHAGIDRQSSRWNREFGDSSPSASPSQSRYSGGGISSPSTRSERPSGGSSSTSSSSRRTTSTRRTSGSSSSPSSGRERSGSGFGPTTISDDSSDDEPSNITIRRGGRGTKKASTMRPSSGSGGGGKKIRRPSFGEESAPAPALVKRTQRKKTQATSSSSGGIGSLLSFDESSPTVAQTPGRTRTNPTTTATTTAATDDDWGFPDDDDDDWGKFPDQSSAQAQAQAPASVVPVRDQPPASAASFFDLPLPGGGVMVPTNSSEDVPAPVSGGFGDDLDSAFGDDDGFGMTSAVDGASVGGGGGDGSSGGGGGGDDLLLSFASGLFADQKKQGSGATQGSGSGQKKRMTIRELRAARGKASPRTVPQTSSVPQQHQHQHQHQQQQQFGWPQTQPQPPMQAYPPQHQHMQRGFPQTRPQHQVPRAQPPPASTTNFDSWFD